MSTTRTSSRDWVDVVVTPFSDNMQLSFANTDIRPPSNAVHLEMGGVDEYVEVEEFLDVVRTHTLSAYDYLSRPSPQS